MHTARKPIKLLGTTIVLLSSMAVGPRFTCPAAAEPTAKDAVQPELIVRDQYNMQPPHFSKDAAVKIDYDIVYVRAPHGKYVWPDVGAPILMEPGADLMLLHPDGRDELLVKGGSQGSVADPYVSFDGQSVYYSFFYATAGADIYKIHVPTRKVVRLTDNGGQNSPRHQRLPLRSQRRLDDPVDGTIRPAGRES